MEDRIRYSDADLQEFKAIIQQKIEKAEKDWALLKESFKKELKRSAKNKMRYWQADRKNSSAT